MISSFLPQLSFNWRTFSRRVTAHWWRHSGQKFKYEPIWTREIPDIRLQHELNVISGTRKAAGFKSLRRGSEAATRGVLWKRVFLEIS